MKTRTTEKYLLLAALFAAFPLRLGTDHSGRLILIAPTALAESGSGSDGNGGGGNSGSGGGDDGEGNSGSGGGDDGEGGDDGDSGDDGQGDDSGGDGEGDDAGDDGEGDDAGDDGENSAEKEGTPSGGAKSRPTKIEKLSNGARIIFSDGSHEEIRNGQFARTNRNGQVVERRSARGSDLARMRALLGDRNATVEKAPSGINSRAVKATYRGRNIDILYSNGWREQVSSGRYNLIDQFGRVITSRRASQADRTRLSRFRK